MTVETAMNSSWERSAFGGDDDKKEGLDVFGANFADIDVWGQASCEDSCSTAETSTTSTISSGMEKTTQMRRQREAPVAKNESSALTFVERALDVVAVAPPPPPPAPAPADFFTPPTSSGRKVSSSKDTLPVCPRSEYIPRRTASASDFVSSPLMQCPTSAKASVGRSVRSMTIKADGPSDGLRVAIGTSTRLGSRRNSGGRTGASISQSDHGGTRRSRRSLPATDADVPSSDIRRRQSVSTAPRTPARKLRASVRLPDKSKVGKDSSTTQEDSPTIGTIYVGGVRTTATSSDRANANKPKGGAASRRIKKVVAENFNDSCSKMEDFFQERLQGPQVSSAGAYNMPLAGKSDLRSSASRSSRTSRRRESSATSKKQVSGAPRNSNKKKELLEELHSSFDIFEEFLMEKDNSHVVVAGDDTVKATTEHSIAGSRTTLPLAGSSVSAAGANGRKENPLRRSEQSRTRKSRSDQTQNFSKEMNKSFELFDDFMKKNEGEAGGASSSSSSPKKDQKEVADPEDSRSRTSRRSSNDGGRRNRSASRGRRSQFKARRNISGDEWQGLSTAVKVDF